MDFDQLSDTQLVATVKQLAEQEREATAALVRSLAEVDSRRLYLRDGCSSLFTWCTQVLGLGEGAAYSRIEVARAGRRVPDLLAALDDGSLTLASARVLAPHVTPENHAELIAEARHKSRREVERIVAAVHPLAEVADRLLHGPLEDAPCCHSEHIRPRVGLRQEGPFVDLTDQRVRARIYRTVAHTIDRGGGA